MCITIPVADPGEGGDRGPNPPPPFLDQSEARRSEKKFFGDQAPTFQRVWMTPPTPLSQGPDPAVVFEDPSNGSNTRRDRREPDIKSLYYHELAKTITAALKKNRYLFVQTNRTMVFLKDILHHWQMDSGGQAGILENSPSHFTTAYFPTMDGE